MTQIEGTTKRAIGEALRAQAQADLDADRERFAREHAAAQVDQEGSFSVDDLSQSDAAGDLAGMADQAVVASEGTLATIGDLDLTPTDVVRPGAVVGFDGARFVVGVAAAPFDVDGVTYEGISTDSPAYAAIDGKRAGDTFVVGDVQHTLDEVG